jgi:hypothetical protein
MKHLLLAASVLIARGLLVHFPMQAAGDPITSYEPSNERRVVCHDSAHVTVQILSEPLPSDRAELNSFLWDNFISGVEPSRFECPILRWQERWETFAQALVDKAKADSLDAESLQICLAKVLEDAGRNAYLPISASYATYRGAPVWVILVKWEWADSSPQEVLGHARVYVLDAKEARQLGFVTCS